MPHCGRFIEPAVSRREMLRTAAGGFGALALAALAAEPSYGAIASAAALKGHPHGHGQLQFEPKARNVIFLYMDGGPSHVDTFDPKPRLAKENGQPFKMKIEATQFNNNGNTLASPWKFNRRGESGIPVSDLFPCVGRLADELTIVRSMVSEFSVHTSANYFLHSGNGQQGRPSMGAWITYGLGSECDNLPGFVVLNGGLIPVGGLDNFTNGFLPATYQASILKPDGQAIANIRPLESRAELQQNKLALLRKLDQHALQRQGPSDPLESAIANYELAFRMQTAVPELLDLSRESEATRRLYGLDSRFAPTRTFAMECLLARRLVERGVRFVELTCPMVPGNDRWDQHGSLKHGHETNALAVDQPIAGLLADLKARGLLESTLVVWAGEFGRTPFAQGSDGRDHNPFGFTVWLAGGGARRGTIYGATDEYGYKAIDGKVTIYDLHATMLRLLGIDHKKLTIRFGGRDMRLTDVHGEVVTGIIEA
jgi:hypothetical protein